MKKTVVVIVCGVVILLVLFCGCKKEQVNSVKVDDQPMVDSVELVDGESGEPIEENEAWAEMESDYISFNDAISYSNVAFIGEYVREIKDTEMGTLEREFKVNRVIYGAVSEDTVYVYDYIGSVSGPGFDTYNTTDNPYEEGKRYILIADKVQNIMYDHDRYMLPGCLLLNVDDNDYREYDKDLEFASEEEIIEVIMSECDYADNNEDLADTKAYEPGIEAMVSEAEYIGVIEVLNLEITGEEHNGNTYCCKVKELLKGQEEDMTKREDETFLLVVFKDTVEEERDYIIGFNQVDQDSLIYIEATVDAVYENSVENRDAILTKLE